MTQSDTASAGSKEGEILDLIPPLKPCPWEDAQECAAVEAAVMQNLDPQTVHEKAVARDVADCLWKILRTRDLERCVAVLGYRKTVAQLIDDGFLAPFSKDTPGLQLARRLTSPDTRSEALTDLAAHQVDEDDIKAGAYLETFHENEALHRRVIQLEERRRILMSDYRELQSQRAVDALEDAEVLESYDH